MSALESARQELTSRAIDYAEGGGCDLQPDECGRELVAAILLGLNPPDDDMSFGSILMDAVVDAVLFIRDQPCSCADTFDDDGACRRCQVLGRHRDIKVDR